MKNAGFSDFVEKVEKGLCPTCSQEIDMDDFEDSLSIREFQVSGMCQKCQNDFFGNDDYNSEFQHPKGYEQPKVIKKERYIAKEDEFVTDDYQMFSGQGEAVRQKYHKYIGKSGNTWLVADSEWAAENVYVTDSPKNNGTQGFGGAVLKMPLVNGEIFELKGGWHTNSDALFSDTGIDIRNKYRTFVVLAKERFSLDDGTWRIGFKGILYKDKEPTLGHFNRYKDLIKQYPEAKYYYSSSRGGSSSGSIS